MLLQLLGPVIIVDLGLLDVETFLIMMMVAYISVGVCVHHHQWMGPNSLTHLLIHPNGGGGSKFKVKNMGKERKKVFVISLLFTVCKSVLRKKWCGKIHRRLKRCYYGVTIMITTTTITNTSSNTATTITYLSRFYFLFHGLAIRWIQKKKLETRSNFQEFFSSTTTQAWAKQMKKKIEKF